MPPPWRLRSRRKIEKPGRDNSESQISEESQDSTIPMRTGKYKGKLRQELRHRNTTKHLWKEKASQDEPHPIVSLPSVDCIIVHALVVLVLMLYGHHSTFQTIMLQFIIIRTFCNSSVIHKLINTVKQAR